MAFIEPLTDILIQDFVDFHKHIPCIAVKIACDACVDCRVGESHRDAAQDDLCWQMAGSAALHPPYTAP